MQRLNGERNNAKKSTIKIPVYIFGEKVCHYGSYKPKRPFSIDIENLKALGYPVLLVCVVINSMYIKRLYYNVNHIFKFLVTY